MQQIQKKSHTKRNLVILGCIVALAGTFLALEMTGVTNLLGWNTLTTEQKQEMKANADAKKDFIENSDIKTGENQDPSATNDPSPTEDPNNLEVTARQEADGSVTVLTKLYDYSGGICALEATNANKTAAQTAQVIYQPQFSTCAGFSIPLSQLGTGTWSIKVTVTQNDLSATKTTSLEVK